MVATINNIRLFYNIAGTTDGLPIVFIHGFPFSSEMWEPQLSTFPPTLRMVTYDVRGLGKSEVGEGQYTIELFVDDLLALLDYLAIEQAILCGLSMGGYIAQRFLQRHPERVQGLILCNTKSEADSNQAKIQRAKTIQLVKKEGIQTFAGNFIQKLFSPVTFERKRHVVDTIHSIILRTPILGFCGAQLALAARTDTTELLPTITVPTLLIAGAHDQFSPPAVMEGMHHAVKGSELIVLPNSGHMSNLEDTEMFNDIVLKFLAKHFGVR